MIFKIVDGRSCFYQWDIDRQIEVSDPTIKEVHFCNRTEACSLVVEVKDGIANVPNKVLQSGYQVRVFGYDGKATLHEATFEVKARTKPIDYIYTETEIKHYEDLERRLDEIEENGISEEVISNAVYEYLEENPIEMTGYATEEYVNEAVSNVSVDLSGYAKESYVDSAITQSVSGLAKKEDIPDVSEFISEIPSEYITESELNAKGYLTQHQDISGKADVNHTHTGYAKSVHTHDMADINGLQLALSDKASIEYVDEAIKNIDIPEGGNVDLSDYYTKEEIDSTVATLEEANKFELIISRRNRTEEYYYITSEEADKIYVNPLKYKISYYKVGESDEEYTYIKRYTPEGGGGTALLFTAHSFESNLAGSPVAGTKNMAFKAITVSTNNKDSDGNYIITEITSIDLASKDYVDDALANLDIPEAEVDLTNYYTKEETTQAIQDALSAIGVAEGGAY